MTCLKKAYGETVVRNKLNEKLIYLLKEKFEAEVFICSLIAFHFKFQKKNIP